MYKTLVAKSKMNIIALQNYTVGVQDTDRGPYAYKNNSQQIWWWAGDVLLPTSIGIFTITDQFLAFWLADFHDR